MPWRNKFIAPRRHPLALSAYAVILLLGFLFVIGVFQSEVIDQLLHGPFWRTVWEWLLTIGGAVSLVGALWWRDLEDALWLERLGAIASVSGLLTYSIAISTIAGFQASTWLLLGVLALGCLARAVQITAEMRRIQRLASSYFEGGGGEQHEP